MGCHMSKKNMTNHQSSVQFNSTPNLSNTNIKINSFDYVIEFQRSESAGHSQSRKLSLGSTTIKKANDNNTPKFGCSHRVQPPDMLLNKCMKRPTNFTEATTLSQKQVSFKTIGINPVSKSRRKFRKKYDISNLV